MIAVITGDIVNSQQADAQQWLPLLKRSLNHYGKSPKVWEIYRGDSFQLAIKQPERALEALIHLKSAIKSIKGLDVRMAAGIGMVSTRAEAITQSQGEAFQFSGRQFDRLKAEKTNMLLQTPWPSWDEAVTIFLKLALSIMDNWSPAAAEIVHQMIQHPELGQKELGQLLGISQSSVSERQSRAYSNEILNLETYFRKQTAQLLTQ